MYCIGIDLGGTNISCGVVNEKYEIVGRGKLKTNAPRPGEEIAADMAKACMAAVEDAGISFADIKEVGIGSPGMIDRENGIIEFAGNLGFHHVPLAKYCKDILGIPVTIANDADAAAYGEFIAGAGKGTRSFVAITLGTGVGSGIIIDGKILKGGNNAVGEFGHTVIVYGGAPCTCGRKGCFEAYASATGLIRQTKEAMEKDKKSVLWQLCEGDISKVSGRTAFQAERMGDKLGAEVVKQYIDYLACGVTNAINIFQPEVVCIGGGICHEGDPLMIPLEKRIREQQFGGVFEGQSKICRAELGNDAGIIGAAFIRNAIN